MQASRVHTCDMPTWVAGIAICVLATEASVILYSVPMWCVCVCVHRRLIPNVRRRF